jgi:uncharacterized protein (TIGR02001 family)
MNSKRILASAVFALLTAPFAASAQDEASSPFSWNITGVSDYVWRGVSQTDENPTAQAGFTYTSPVGIYAGAWASGVDFGDGDPDYELDYFVGYNVDLNETVNFDILLNRYTYPGASELNFNELIAKTTFAEDYSVTLAYSNDFGGSETDAFYINGAASYGLPQDYSLDFSVGRSFFEREYSENYLDWSVGVSKSFGAVSASLAYVGVDGNGRDIYGELASSRVVLTLDVGM